MKIRVLSKLLPALLSPSLTLAQQAGTYETEQKPTITLKECTVAGGCTSRKAKLTLDANWRWIHETNGYQNCYTGNQWDTGKCSDPAQCAQNCALEGVSKQKYENTYGIKQLQDGVRLNFATDHQYGVNVGSRLYVMEDDENYAMFYLKNREFSFEVDVSELYCGMNGAMYFTEMQANGGKGIGSNNAGAKYGTGYCDAQCPHDMKFIDGEANVVDWTTNPNDKSNNMGAGKYGACCAEMDIWEANSMASAFTPHTCSTEKLYRCSDPLECGDNGSGYRYDGVCDKDGCDINPYRMGNEDFYGRGDHYAVNTLKPMTVVTQFLTNDGTDTGDFSEMRRLYIQDGKIVHSPPSTILGPGKESDSITDQFCDDKKDLFGDVNDYQEHGGMKGMGESLDRGHAMIFSLWDDVEVNMLWLDSAYPLDKSTTDPGIKRGDCPGGETSTPTYLRGKYPNGGVVFKNAAVGEIGSTYVSPTPETPTNKPTPKPTTVSEGCFSNDYKDCLPKSYSNGPASCNTVWLPNGPQQGCIALWGDCTDNSSSCCGNAVCFGDADHAACVPPADSTNSPTSKPTTPEPTPPTCTMCDDRETSWQIQNGFDCATDTVRMDKKCNKDAKWANKGYCRLSCYNAGSGYPGDVCCDGILFDRKSLRGR
jgi:cellulose 1,4-beta-cellobiosidase